MNKARWIIRYTFLGLLFAASGVWCIFSLISLNAIKKTVNSLGLLDLAMTSSDEAIELLERQALYTKYLNVGLIIAGVILAAIILLVIYHIVSTKGAEKFKAMQKASAEKKAAAQKIAEEKVAAQKAAAEAAKAAKPAEEGFCPGCGTHYDDMTGFCTKCGYDLSK